MMMRGQRNWAPVQFGGNLIGYRTLARYGLHADILPEKSGGWHVEVITGKDSRVYKKVPGSLEDARTAGEKMLRAAERRRKMSLYQLGQLVEVTRDQRGTVFRQGVRGTVVDIREDAGRPTYYSVQLAEGMRLWLDKEEIRGVHAGEVVR
jgi:hypothetical protein